MTTQEETQTAQATAPITAAPSEDGAAPEFMEVFTGARLNFIPAGTFIQGGPTASEPDQPFREVELTRDFYMQTTPVTQKQWRMVMGNNPSHHQEPDGSTDDHPVENVSWYDAVKYCNKLSEMCGREPVYDIREENGKIEVEIISEDRNGFRLPTEAEWEYGAGCWTSPDGRYGELDDIAWYSGNSGYRTHPVGQKLPNMWGLYDMIGNVWEWCYDWYGPYEVPSDKKKRKPRAAKKKA